MSDRKWLTWITPLVVARRQYGLARAMGDGMAQVLAWDHILQALPMADLAAERLCKRVDWWVKDDESWAGGPVWYGQPRKK